MITARTMEKAVPNTVMISVWRRPRSTLGSKTKSPTIDHSMFGFVARPWITETRKNPTTTASTPRP